MSLWTSRGQVCIHGAFSLKSCGQGGESTLSFLPLKVTDLHKYKYLIVGKKFFSTFLCHQQLSSHYDHAKLFLMNLKNIKSISVVCAGNICRSPIGEVVLRDRLEKAGLEIFVDSAGTGNWHEGEDANAKTNKVLRESGYEVAHTARQFKNQWFEERDLILVMDLENKKNLLAIAPKEHVHKIHLMRKFDPKLNDLTDDHEDLIVPDPYHEPIDDFYEVLDMLEKAADGLVNLLKK
jgi:protein-tyrosine phosphatase